MQSYPRDEFDDVPEDSARRGAYRGQTPKSPISDKGTWALSIVGILGLILGGVMFVVQPRTLAPESANNISAATGNNSSSAATDEKKQPSELNVEIYNAGAYPGAASEVQKELKKAGYNVSSTANWKGEAMPNSMVYFANGNIDEANTVANGLGIEYFEEDPDTKVDIYVVLASDFAGVPDGGFEANSTASASVSASPTAQ